MRKRKKSLQASESKIQIKRIVSELPYPVNTISFNEKFPLIAVLSTFISVLYIIDERKNVFLPRYSHEGIYCLQNNLKFFFIIMSRTADLFHVHVKSLNDYPSRKIGTLIDQSNGYSMF